MPMTISSHSHGQGLLPPNFSVCRFAVGPNIPRELAPIPHTRCPTTRRWSARSLQEQTPSKTFRHPSSDYGVMTAVWCFLEAGTPWTWRQSYRDQSKGIIWRPTKIYRGVCSRQPQLSRNCRSWSAADSRQRTIPGSTTDNRRT